jgi:hypothetical protein
VHPFGLQGLKFQQHGGGGLQQGLGGHGFGHGLGGHGFGHGFAQGVGAGFGQGFGQEAGAGAGVDTGAGAGVDFTHSVGQSTIGEPLSTVWSSAAVPETAHRLIARIGKNFLNILYLNIKDFILLQ